jgi:hypothetical protein
MRSAKFLQTAAYFYLGAFTVLSLHYLAWVIESRIGNKIGPEVGLDLMALSHSIAFLPYFGAFVAIEYGLSHFHAAIFERQFLFPVALSTGAIVSYTFLYELDFLFWLFYQKGAGTIILSVISVELLVLLMHAVIVWRVSRS